MNANAWCAVFSFYSICPLWKLGLRSGGCRLPVDARRPPVDRRSIVGCDRSIYCHLTAGIGGCRTTDGPSAMHGMRWKGDPECRRMFYCAIRAERCYYSVSIRQFPVQLVRNQLGGRGLETGWHRGRDAGPQRQDGRVE